MDDLMIRSNHPTYDFNEIYEGYSRIAFARLLNSTACLYSNGIRPFPEEVWFDLMEKLRKEINSGKISVIILSVDSTDEAAEKGFSMGAVDYITKPFRPKELVARVRAVLRRGDASVEA